MSGEVDAINLLGGVSRGEMAIAITDHGALKAFLVQSSEVEQQPADDSGGLWNSCTDLGTAIAVISEDFPVLNIMLSGISVAVMVHHSLEASLDLPLIDNPDMVLQPLIDRKS